MVIWEKAPAKINLTLDVTGKRLDGYHEVDMIMTMIDLADRISFKKIEKNTIILNSNSGNIPNDERNLIYKTAKLIKEKYKINKGVSIFLEKNIPVAAGLAGGSSDAAATIRGLNRLWELDISNDEMMKLGEKIGSDVPFCVNGGTARVRGRGEIVNKITTFPSGWIILAKPIIGVSTKEIYNNLKLAEIKTHPNTDEMQKAIENQDFNKIIKLLENVLEDVTLTLYPEVSHLYKQMKKFAEEGVLMSGSGPTIYALTSKETKAKRINNALRGFCKNVYAVRLLK